MGQGALGSVGSTLGAPMDILTAVWNGINGVANLGGLGVEKAAGAFGADVDIPDIPPITNPYGGSTNIRDVSSKIFESTGGKLIDPNEMTPEEHLAYTISDFAGQGAIGGAGLVKAGAVKTAESAPSLGQTLAKLIPDYVTNAYKQTPGRVLAGDVAGGVGAGTASEMVDRNLPEGLSDIPVVGPAVSPLAQMLAVMLGGSTGSAILNTATRAPSATLKTVTDRLPAKREFQDPNATAPVSKRTVNQAVDFVHENTSDPQSALAKLMGDAEFFKAAGGAMPTTGIMSGDVGLGQLESRLRKDNPKPFIERDMAVRDSAFDDVTAMRPEDGDPTLPRQISENEIAVREASANAKLNTAQQKVEAQDQSDVALGDTYRQPPMTPEQASMMLDKALIGDTAMPMRAEKNAKYKAIDPEGTEMVDTQNLTDLMKQLEAATQGMPSSLRSEYMPEALVSQIKAFEPKIDPKTGENVGGPGEVSFKGLNEWRPALSSMESQARRNGQFKIADAIRGIKSQIGAEAETLASSGSAAGERAAEAGRYYKEDYKPFREGPVGDLMKDVARDPMRDKTPASATANRLIVRGPGAPEAGANVNEAISRASPPAANASRGAIKNYFLADLRNVVGEGGKVSETSLARWIKNNESTLDAYPDFKKEVGGLLDDVRGRGARASSLKAELETAKAGKKQTQKEIDKSAFAIFANTEPEKAVPKLFSADDPVAAVKQLRKSFGGNVAADRGLKAAVADHLVEEFRTTGAAGVSPDASPLSLAKIETTIRRNKKLLTEVFGDDTKYLEQARRRLETLSRRSNQALPGSATAERQGMDKLLRGLLKPTEIIAKLAFGQLQGGGYTRSARLMAEQMPDSTAAARDLVVRMQFDADLAKHILQATPEKIAGPKWSKWLNTRMGWAAAGRESGEDESGDGGD